MIGLTIQVTIARARTRSALITMNTLELAGSNWGARSVICKLEPSDLKLLQELKIQGSGIWMLYKDVCCEEIKDTKTMLIALKENPNLQREIRGKKRAVLKYVKMYD